MRVARMAGVLLVAGLLVGCSAGDRSADKAQVSTAGDGTAGSAPENRLGGGGAAADAPAGKDSSESTADGSQQAADIVGQQRKLARTATVDIVARDVRRATGDVRTITDDAGGYIGAENTEDDDAQLTVKVPADQLDAVLRELDGLGQVRHKRLHAEDVTEQVVDVRTRLASQEASVQRVRELLDRAGSVSEVVAVESELASREAELDSLRARQEELSGRVELSTVHLRLTERAAVPPPEQGGFLSGLADGWRALLAAGGAVLTGLGAVLPFALVLGIPAAAIGWWWLRRRKASVPVTAEVAESA